ncbi:hypothetical protein ABW21_db0203448 [Orbilia brochopaga]|nr:hypothetical protein ABW21_db0203448 [Drechslerella brochopaga]
MSNSSEVPTFTDADMLVILSTSLWIGAFSPNYSNIPIIDVIQKYADLAVETNNSITPELLTQNFGTKPSDADALLSVIFDSETLGNLTMALAAVRDYLPHPTNPTVVIPIFIAFTVVTAFIMVLRLWSRFKIAGGIRSFDWLAVAGFFLTVAWGALAVWHVSVKSSIKAYLVLNMFYPWAMMIIKFSLLLFYYRMTKWNYIQWSAWATAFIVAGTTVATTVLYAVQYPHIDPWNHLIENPRFSRLKLQIAIASIYIITDVIIWVMPMPLVFQLKLYPRERILALITFSLGAVACVASCIRLDAVIKYSDYSGKSSSTLLVDAWTIVELYLTLICASAPALRALAIHYAPKILNSVGSSAFSSAATTSTTIAKKNSAGSNTSVSTAQKPDIKKEVKTTTSELDDIEKEVEKEYLRAEREAEREAQKEAERQAQEEAEREAKKEAENQT